MTLTLTSFLPYAFSGALVGFLVGITGVGGGSLMTPLLTLIFGISPSVAVGTDLAFAAITKGLGTVAHRLHNNVRWNIVKLLASGSLPAAIVTIGILKTFGQLNPAWQHYIKVSIGVSVILTAISLIFRKVLLAKVAAHPNWQFHGTALKIATISVGAVLGVLVSVSSIGAGAIGATMILLLYPHLRAAEVAGTDIAYAVPLTFTAGLGHWWLGNVHFDLLAGLLIGSLPAIWFGAKLAKKLPDRWVRATLAVTLTLVGFKLIS